jgi:hypothetical protein
MPDGLFETEKSLYKIQIGLADFAFFGHDTLALFGFLGKNVAFERFLEGDLTRAGYFKPLFCTRIGSNLWHLSCFCCVPLLADPHRRSTYGAIWGCKSIKKTAHVRFLMNLFEGRH